MSEEDVRDQVEQAEVVDFKAAKAKTESSGSEPGTDLVLNPQDPLPSARKFVETRYTVSDDRTLHHHLGVFYAWDGTCYQPLDEQTARAEMYAFLELAKRMVKDDLKPYQPNRAKVAEVPLAAKGRLVARGVAARSEI